MPELPEVETIRLDLEMALMGDHAIACSVLDRRLMSLRDEVRWKAILLGQPWRHFRRIGKYLWIELANGWRIEFHLRMTGQLLVVKSSSPAPTGRGPTKSRLSIEFASGKILQFRDQRRFGEVRFRAPGERGGTKHPLGPDALSELKRDQFIDIVKTRTTRIQPLLMDQRLIAGIGNIYAQEALFKAGIRPTRSGVRVTRQEAGRLYETLQETLQTAITHRGSSSRNYLDANGDQGSAQTLHSVYRKGKKPCSRCQSELRAIRVGGRGSVFCPQCQK